MEDHGKKKCTTHDGEESPASPVTLVKGRHRWSFSCDQGSEPALLRRLSELAGSEDIPFDWFDAALVSHQLSRRLRPGLFRVQSADRQEPAA